MYKKKLLQSKRGGFAMAIVLCAVILMLIIGVGVLSVGTHSRMLGVRTSSEIAARSAADAGLTKALFTMNQQLADKTWKDNQLPSVTNERVPNTDLSFSYNVAKTTTADGNDLYTIACVGKGGRYQKTVNCVLEMKGIFEYAIYVAENMVLRNGTTISAYNQGADDPPLQIGTKSTNAGAIIAKTGVTINGDVVVGVGGDPDVVINNTTEAAISGQTYPSLINNKTPNINVPQALVDMPSSGSIIAAGTITTSAKYDSINLAADPNKGATLTIDGNVKLYVTGDIRLGNSDVLQIVDQTTNPNASLVIYLGGNLITDNSGAINNLTKDPKKLKIFGLDTCTNVDFKNSGSFYGAIYAPNADVHFYNSVTVYGAVVARSFTQDVNANFYYDMSLRVADPTEIGVYMVIKRWSEQ
jgi:choice-of-anchor A domain-containing protein